MVNPFYIFQLMSVLVWMFDTYIDYACCIIVLSLFSALTSFWSTWRNLKAIQVAAPIFFPSLFGCVSWVIVWLTWLCYYDFAFWVWSEATMISLFGFGARRVSAVVVSRCRDSPS